MDFSDVNIVKLQSGEDDVYYPRKTRSYFTVAEIARDIVSSAGADIINAVVPCGISPADGSPIYTVMDAEHIAKRACDVAAALMDELVSRGWFIEYPTEDLEPKQRLDVEAGRTDAMMPGPFPSFPEPRPLVDVNRGEM